MASSQHDAKTLKSDPGVVYDVQTAFENLNKSVLVASSSAIYFAEMLVTHPFEVLRTQVQTSQTVRSIIWLSSSSAIMLSKG